MKRRNILMLGLLASGFFVACGDQKPAAQQAAATQEQAQPQPEATTPLIKAEDVKVAATVDPKLMAAGKSTYELKCQSCHKLTGEKLVGPGWKGVTERRKPEWIMNMIVNVDQMLNQDPTAQKLLEEHLVRMPNQNLSPDQAREVLEFMRSNDGVK